VTSRGTLLALAAFAAATLAGAGCSSDSASSEGGSQPPTELGNGGSATVRRPSPFVVEESYSPKSLGLKKPSTFAVGPDGNLYVTDAGQRVTVVSPNGEVLRRWGSRGHGPGQFSFVPREADDPVVSAGISVGPDGRVYVADSGNARIDVFSPSGRLIRSFGSFGVRDDQFELPIDPAADKAGNIYVVDDQKQTLAKFSSTGVPQWVIAGQSASDADLIGHFHTSSSGFDAHGRAVVANDDRSRIVYIDARGEKVDAFGKRDDFRDGACEISIDRAGYVFVTSCQDSFDTPHYMEVFDRAHRLVGSWEPSPLGWAPQFGPHGEVWGMAEDGSILRLRLTLQER
jgi:DNA-binding beta-propeller fold protein YncE